MWMAAALASCSESGNRQQGLEQLSSEDSLQAKDSLSILDSAAVQQLVMDSLRRDNTRQADTAALILATSIDTKNVQPQMLVQFAKTLIGTPYQYASANPKTGFDCSGFVTYVFNHFGISVPRSSIDFTDAGSEIGLNKAKPGDLILFTGTNPAERFVGHMGIVVSNTDTLRFIHSTSGKAHGVTVTPLNKYYQGRFIKTIRVFPD